MCLAVPEKIIEIKDKEVTVDYGYEQRKGKIVQGSYKEGDYVIVQAGIVVQKIGKEEAEEALRHFNEVIKEE